MHGIVEFRSPDDHSPFARFVELLENLARPAHRILVSLDPQPTVPGRYPDIERGFQLAEKLVIATVERLHGAGVGKLERQRFQITGSHKRAPSWNALEAIFPP